MHIGTVRPAEAITYGSEAGFHQFHAAETQEPYGSFEVFWDDSDNVGHDRNFDSDGEPVKAGWYWWACFPGCLPDGEAAGPFAYSQQAHEDADEWSPQYDN